VSFIKGQSGNPGGRPQDKPITDALRLAVKENDAKALKNIVRVVVAQAQAGDQWAVQFVTDRLEGKAIQQIETHNLNEYVFAEVPQTDSKEAWMKTAGGASGERKPDRRVN
jgi:hypothetical protein